MTKNWSGLQRTAMKGLAAFFALALAFTVISRASDAFTMARVEVDAIKSGVITNRVTLTGTVNTTGELELYLPGDLRVTEVPAETGDRVKAGDALLRFDADDAREKLSDARDSLRVLELKIANTETSLASDYDDSAVQTAQSSLDQAKADYQRLMEKYDKARTELLDELREAEAALELALGETPEGEDNGVAAAKAELERALADYDKLLAKTEADEKTALEELEAATAALESVESGEAADAVNNVTSARLALEQAQEDHDRLAEKLDGSLARTEDDLTAAEGALRDAQAAYAKAVDKTRDDVIKAAEDAVDKAKKELDSVKEQSDAAVSKAQSDYDQQSAKDNSTNTALDSASKSAESAYQKYLQAVEWYNQLSGSADTGLLEEAQAAVDAARDAYDAARESISELSGGGESTETRALLDTLRKTQDKWRGLVSDAEKALRDANAELADARTKTDFSDQQAVISAQNAVDAAEKTVQSQTRALEDNIRTASDQLLSSERVVQNAERNLRTASDNARKTYDNAKKAYDDAVSGGQEQLQTAWDKVDTARKSLNNTLEGAGKAVDNARKAFDDNEQSYSDQLVSAQRSVQNAERNLASAVKQAEDGRISGDKALRQAEIDMINHQAEKRGLERTIAALEAAAELDGVLTAPADGTVLSVMSKGKSVETSPAAVLTDDSKGFRFEAQVAESDAEKLAVGGKGTMSYTSEGKQYTVDVTVTGIGAPDENSRVTVTASLPSGSYPSGVSAQVTVQSFSDRQNMTLPLTALRTDTNGDYVLTLLEKKTVIGTEYTLVRIPVEVLARDSELMSVKASLTRDDKVVTSASKPVTEGDRVRLP